MQDLELTGNANPLWLRWTGNVATCKTSWKELTIQISEANKKPKTINVTTMSELNFPLQSLNYEELSQKFHHLRNSTT